MNKKILKKIKNDVETAKEISKVLITIDSNNNVKFKQNKNLEKGIGGIIAVVGSAGNMEETLLLEIGTGRSKPYTASTYPGYYVTCRKKFFEINIAQYNAVAPYILHAIQLVTDVRIEKWKCYPSNPFVVKYQNNWYTKRRGFNSRKISIETIPSIMVTLEKTDKFLVNDMLYLFLFSSWTKKKMIGLGKYVDKVLSVYKRKRLKKINFKQFKKLKNVKKIKKDLEKWPDFLIKEMILKYLPNKGKNFFFYELLDLIGWDGITFSEEKEKALASFIYLNKDVSIMEIGNRINYIKENDKFIFFNICPSNYDPTKK